MRRKSKVLLSSPEQRRAITSTVRMELLEHLHAGPATVATLAERMGRTPNSLYHHVRILTEAGILRQIDTRRSRAREQAVYDVTAEVFELTGESGESAAEEKTARVILNKAEREFTQALQDHPEDMRRKEFYIGRMRAQLSTGSRKQVARHIAAIQKIFSEEMRRHPHPNARLRACSFTGVFLPSP